MPRTLLEVCVDSLQPALAAVASGADRLEVNTRLDLDGLTPTTELLHELRRQTDVPLVAMVRPRAGDFVYDADERTQMAEHLDRVLLAGAHGVALGALTFQGSVDVALCRELTCRAGDIPVVFHRAFDVASDPFDTLDTLIDLGITRVLTSGQATTAYEGRDMLARLIERAAGRIEILPGAGIRDDNVRAIIETTGCTQVHGSFRDCVPEVRAILDQQR